MTPHDLDLTRLDNERDLVRLTELLGSTGYSLSPDRLIVISLFGDDSGNNSILDLSRFLYNLNLLFEVNQLAVDPKYEDTPLPRSFSPQRSRLDELERLTLTRIKRESPWELVTSLVASPFGFVSASATCVMLAKAFNLSLGALKNLAETWKVVEDIFNSRMERKERRLRIEGLEQEKSRNKGPEVATDTSADKPEGTGQITASYVTGEEHIVRYRERRLSILRGTGFTIKSVDIEIVDRIR